MIEQSDVVLSVHDEGENALRADCVLLEPDREISAWIRVGVPDLRIRDAGWEIYRLPGEKYAFGRIPELKGVKAYLNAGPELSAALVPLAGHPCRPLILECVRGVIQSDCFIFRELGYASEQDYDRGFAELYKNSCLSYSNADEWEPRERFFPRRKGVVFTRVISVLVEDEPDGYRLAVGFRDTHQQLNARLRTDRSGTVLDAEGNFTLYPDVLCTKTMALIKNLAGLRLAGMSKGKLGAIVGGPSGCDHLLSMLYRAGETLGSAIERDLRPSGFEPLSGDRENEQGRLPRI
ncbi:MAG: DUF2889 domain-containing protein [Synergistaceae bacterium]|jgi:hypothetical protein|nr:DUF2889 domain-containing protein [Synergistaceae bacterium]